MRQYTMQENMSAANNAAADITQYLLSLPFTVKVQNVEKDPYYQKLDIDLLWFYRLKGKTYMKTIEIKGDRYAHTGNYFIETVSNLTKNTPGCFLYSQCDLLFYYFLDTKELNIIPMKRAREWFLSNIHRFEEKKLSTKFLNGKIAYYSKGRIVPKKILNSEVPGVKTIYLNKIAQAS